MDQTAVVARERSQLTRLQHLIDVMFALMLWKIVSPLPIPEEEEGWTWSFGAVAGFLGENGATFVMAIIGVILIIIYWVQNNQLFGNLARTNGPHTSFAIFQIVFLAFYAYAMRLGESFGSPGTLALQSVALAGVGFTGVAGWSYAMKDRRLLADSITDSGARELRLSVLPEPIAAVITIPIAFIGPWWWEIAWLTMLPIGAWLRRYEQKRNASKSG